MNIMRHIFHWADVCENTKAKAEAFIVVEPETGLVDGWYMKIRDADKAVNSWNDRRPGFTHGVVGVPKVAMRYLKDEWMMNRADHKPKLSIVK